MKESVLRALKEASGPLSGQVLADELGISRSALWKHVQKLRDLGCEIDGSPKVGYRLLSVPDAIFAGELAALVPPAFRDSVVGLDAVDSTNDRAKELASAGKLKPAGLVVAERQTGGRGRFGRSWASPVGGIWFTMVVRPEIPVALAARMPLLASVVISSVLKRVTGLDARIKWPNDILIEEKKVAGILTELAAELGRVDYLVVGIGLNANFPVEALDQPDLNATTLLDETGAAVDRTALVSMIVTDIWEALPALADGFDVILEQWREFSATLGRRITLETAGERIEGTAVDLDSEGGLVVRTAGGEQRIFRAGEVTLRKTD